MKYPAMVRQGGGVLSWIYTVGIGFTQSNYKIKKVIALILTWLYLRNKQHREIDTKLDKTNELDNNAEKNKNKDDTTVNTNMIY